MIRSLRFCLILLACTLVESKHSQRPECLLTDEDIFPEDFIFGSATSSYQIEGGWNADGKGPSIWDHGIHEQPERIFDGSNGDIACDSYNKWMEDVKALNNTGFNAYRFSISWPRVMPSGEPSTLNQAGLAYYHRLIDALLDHEITPMITMYHWDLPQALQDLGGFLNPMMADWFEDYADVLFREFGSKVKRWGTFNEPLMICQLGYEFQFFAPFINAAANGGEYHCAYHLLLAHARAYHLYNDRYRDTQHGTIGIVNVLHYYYPADGQDYFNANRAMQYNFGLYAHPISNGGWPDLLVDEIEANSRAEGRIASRLPVMDDATKEYIRGTSDWFGLNYYTAYLVAPDPDANDKFGIEKDLGLLIFKDETWETSPGGVIHRVPEGFRDVMNFVAESYGNPEIWILENGWGDVESVHDTSRIRYFSEHLQEILRVRKCDGINVKQYYAWSLLDNFEWASGYTQKFGLHHVDFTDPERRRTPKDSVKFFTKLIKSRKLVVHSYQ